MVTPYFTQHRPPALVATLPPIEQNSYDDGSGGYQSPCSAAAALTSLLKAPGSTTATWQVGSISTAAIRSRLSTMPPSTALDPPERPLPGAPRHHRHPVRRRPPDRGLHLSGVLRADHGHGGAGVGVLGAVPAVLLDPLGVGDDDTLGQGVDQLGEMGGHAPIEPFTPG